MARDGAAWLERKLLCCRTVTIKVRYDDFTTITRSHSQRSRRRATRTTSPRARRAARADRSRPSAGSVARRERAQSRGSHGRSEDSPLPLFDGIDEDREAD